MLVVVIHRLVDHEPLVVGVLDPAGLRDDREVAAQLPADPVELRANLRQRPCRPVAQDLVVDDVAAALLPVGIGAGLRAATSR